MPRPTFVVIGWMAATAAAVGVAYAGVSAVAGRVVEPLPSAVGLPDVTDTAGASPTDSPSTTLEAPSRTPGTGQPTPASRPSTSTPTTPEDADPGTVAPPPRSSPADEPPPPASSAEVRSYALVGGSATLRFEPGRVTVVSAEPSQGFVVDVEGNGTAEVTVEFESDDHRSRLKGSWEDGPRERVEEDDREHDGDEPDEADED